MLCVSPNTLNGIQLAVIFGNKNAAMALPLNVGFHFSLLKLKIVHEAMHFSLFQYHSELVPYFKKTLASLCK